MEQDPFDEILFLDDSYHQLGWEEGKRAGQEKGYQHGFEMGRLKAFEFYKEVGYYAGFASSWMDYAVKQDSR